MPIRKKFFVLVFLLQLVQVSFQSILAQVPSTREYSVEDGLPSSNVYFTFQDGKGFIWVCTEKGVAKFNGYEFSVITTKDGLPSNDVFGMIEDEGGKLWLNTFNQIVYLENDNVNTIDFPEFEGKIVFHNIDPDGNHFITADNKLYIHREHGVTSAFENEYLARHGDYFLMPSTGEANVLSESLNNHQQGIYFDGNFFATKDSYFKEKVIEGKNSNFPLGIFEFGKTKLFFVEYRQISILEDGMRTTINVKKDLNKSSGISGSRKINDSLFYLRFDNSIEIYSESLVKQTEFEFLNSFRVNNLNFDSNNNLWISTNHGLFFLGAATYFSKTIRFGNQDLNSISAIHNTHEKLWVGNDKGEFYSYQNGITQAYIIPGILNSKIGGIYSNKGIIYIGGKTALAIMEKEELPLFTLESTIDKKAAIRNLKQIKLNKELAEFSTVKNINSNKNGEFQITFSSGVVSIDTMLEKKILSNKRSYAVVKDSSGGFWIGHKDGLELFKNDSLVNYRLKNPYLSKGINDLAIDNFNHIWIATDGFGVLCFKDSFKVDIPALKNLIINKIHVSDENQIFIGTTEGMECLTIESYFPFKYSRRRISTAHGLPSNEVTDIATDEKQIYVSTTQGVTILSKANLETSHEPPILHFAKISVNNESLPIKKEYEFHYNKKNIKIEFICLSYKSDKSLIYHYKMDGLDDHWMQTTNRFKEYATLPPGDYSFHLKAEDVDEMITSEKSIHFSIAPPFWNTYSFFLLILGFTVLLIIAFLQWRTNEIKKRVKAKNLIHQQIAQSELKALQAQMNPHFVFNALNAIQDYIYQREPYFAGQYLAKFARLMRLFLESSRNRFIVLGDEIQLLNLYIELEQLRYKDKFDFEINVEQGINPMEIEIPSTVLQPFVENAINHGLAHGSEKGKLLISFSIQGSILLCIIQDNGIGRTKSIALRKKSIPAYKSRGMQIVEERRAILSYLENMDTSIEVIDIINKQNEAIGTKVVIELPLAEDYKFNNI